mgnify:CR=1 FL=1
MPIKCTTPMSQIDKYIKQQLERQERALIRTLSYVGERCVNEARAYNGKAYTDQTGNLRSSVGYVVAVDGKIRSSSTFETVLNGDEGGKTGKAYAKELVSKYPQGAVLIVVAGMNYAQYVSAKGYNVLSSAELLAEQLVPTLLKQLGTLNNDSQQ